MYRLAAAAATLALTLAGCGTSHHAKTSRPVVAHLPPTQSAMGSVAPAGWGGTPKGRLLPPAVAATPTVEMLDGIAVSAFSGLHPFAVAGYTAGIWPDYLALHAAFPKAHAISIAISAIWHADCLDVEPGDAVPSQAGPWALADIAAGFAVPCVYGDLSEMPAIKASLAAALGANWRARVMLWLAWYRFTPGLVAGYDAVQWSDRGGNLAPGRNLDQSTVTLQFLELAQPPYVPPTPKPTRVICLGPHAQKSAMCKAVQAQYAHDISAAKSSTAAVTGTQQTIARLNARLATFQQRVRYFTQAAAGLLKAWS